MSGPITHTAHNRRQNIIFHKSNLLTTFLQHDITSARSLYRTVMSAIPCFEMQFPLARLVKAEIVSPYCRILINTGMGNLTSPGQNALSWSLSRNGRNNGSTLQNPAMPPGSRLPNSTPELPCESPPRLTRARTGVR